MDPVIANKAIKVATTPEIGIVSPISKPKTRTAPINPNTIPNHCFQVVINAEDHNKININGNNHH